MRITYRSIYDVAQPNQTENDRTLRGLLVFVRLRHDRTFNLQDFPTNAGARFCKTLGKIFTRTLINSSYTNQRQTFIYLLLFSLNINFNFAIYFYRNYYITVRVSYRLITRFFVIFISIILVLNQHSIYYSCDFKHHTFH